MMNYQELLISVDEIIKEFGQPVVITNGTSTMYNPDTGLVTTTVNTIQANGVTVNYNLNAIDGTMIQQGDVKLILSPIGITDITTAQSATVQGKEYTIVPPIKTNSPAGIPVSYEVNLRGVQ